MACQSTTQSAEALPANISCHSRDAAGSGSETEASSGFLSSGAFAATSFASFGFAAPFALAFALGIGFADASAGASRDVT